MKVLTLEQKINMIFEYLKYIEEIGVPSTYHKAGTLNPASFELMKPSMFGAGGGTKKFAQAITKPKAMASLTKIGSSGTGGAKAVDAAIKARAAKSAGPGLLSKIGKFAKKVKFLR